LQSRWLNKHAVAEHTKRQAHATGRDGRHGRGADAGGGAGGHYLSTAMKLGGDIRRQYQPWIDQVMTAIAGGPGDGAGAGAGAIVVASKKKGSAGAGARRTAAAAGGGKKGRKTIPSRPVPPTASARGQGKKKTGLKLKKPRRAADVAATLRERSEADGTKRGRKRSKAGRGSDDDDDDSAAAAAADDEDSNAGAEKDEEEEEEDEEEEVLADYCPFDATVFFGDLNYRLEVRGCPT